MRRKNERLRGARYGFNTRADSRSQNNYHQSQTKLGGGTFVFVCSVESNNDCSNNFTSHKTCAKVSKKLQALQTTACAAKLRLERARRESVSGSEFTQSVCSKLPDLERGISHKVAPCTFTPTGASVFETTSAGRFKMTVFRLRHHLAQFKTKLGLLSNTVERHLPATES